MKKFYIYLVTIVIASCNTADTEPNFDTRKMISDITKNVIIPAVNHFKDSSTSLDNSIATYVDNASITNLEIVKENWKSTAKAYANIYAFNIGEVKAEFTHQSLYNWPTLGIAIENFIQNKDVTVAEVKNFSPQAKTLSGLGYLLFKGTTEKTHLDFTTDLKRRAYIKFISSELKERAEKLANKWSASGENYAETFINNDKTGLNSSLNIIFNGIYNVVNTVKVSKIGKPGGLENSSNTSISEIQAQYSEASIDLTIENIKSVRNVLFNPNGLGLTDNIKAITKNDELTIALKSQIEKAIAALKAINGPLHIAVDSDKVAVKKAYTELTTLDVLISTDIRSILSIIITATDNDGD